MSKFKNLKLLLSVTLILSLVFVFNSCYAAGLDLIDDLTSNNQSSDDNTTTNTSDNTSTNNYNNSSDDEDSKYIKSLLYKSKLKS